MMDLDDLDYEEEEVAVGAAAAGPNPEGPFTESMYKIDGGGVTLYWNGDSWQPKPGTPEAAAAATGPTPGTTPAETVTPVGGPHFFASPAGSLRMGNETISIRTNIMDTLEKVFVEHRLEVVNPEGFLVTPLHIVKTVAQDTNTRLHTEVYIIQGGPDNKDQRYRVEIFFGDARGMGQAPVRGLAYQLAAIDLIEKNKLQNKDPLPMYGMPPGCRIHPHIVRDFVNLCRENQLGVPRITFRNSNRPFEEVELFQCIVFVGQMEMVASSDSRPMARRLAVKLMYDSMASQPYPEMTTCIGNECIGFQRLRDAGIRPLVSKTKRDWLLKNRGIGGGKLLHYPDEEPDDGDEIEEKDCVEYHYQQKQARRVALNLDAPVTDGDEEMQE